MWHCLEFTVLQSLKCQCSEVLCSTPVKSIVLHPGCGALVWSCTIDLAVQLDGESTSDPPTGWPHDHGPTNVGAMVKTPKDHKQQVSRL